jgi:Rieske Fe-S protein
MQRRSLLKLLTGALGAITAATVVAPILALIGDPLRRKGESGADQSLAVAELEKLPEGVPTRAQVIAPTVRDAWSKLEKVPLGAVWLVRKGPSVCALSTTCPHAGCFVDYEPGNHRFGCPCHGSAFDLDGKTMSGPSPRPMDALETEVRDGKVLVRFQRFRQATSTKEPV